MDCSSISKVGCNVPQGKLRLLVLKEEHDSPIAGHRGEKTTIAAVSKEVLLAVHEGGDSPLCEDLCEVPNEPSLIPEASRALATIALFRQGHGIVCPWTSSQVCRSRKDMMPSL